MLLLTATPVQNDMDELFNLVSLLTPGQLHTYDRFLERYVASADRRVPTHVSELPGRPRDVMGRNPPGVAFTIPPTRGPPPSGRWGAAGGRLFHRLSPLLSGADTSSP